MNWVAFSAKRSWEGGLQRTVKERERKISGKFLDMFETEILASLKRQGYTAARRVVM